MVSRSTSLHPGHPPEVLAGDPPTPAAAHRMSTRKRMLFFLTAWLIVLMPFLFWWSTWFGRHLTDQQITEYLNDAKHPRHIQHALVQLGERMGRHDAGAARWYADLVRLASYPVEEVRNTDAWVMGQDTSDVAFHKTLLTMLGDSSLLVRGNAALSLVRFGDASGRAQIVALLQPAVITAPSAGVVSDTDKIGTPIHQGGVIAKLQDGQRTIEVRSPISGRIRTLNTQKAANVAQGFEIATVAPGDEQVWEALRALYLIGQLDDLPAILPYGRELPEIPDRVRQQALLTEKAIRERAAQRPADSGPSPGQKRSQLSKITKRALWVARFSLKMSLSEPQHLIGHLPDFLFYLSDIHHYDGVPRTAIQEAPVRTFAETLFAANTKDGINLNATEWRVVFVIHPKHAILDRAVLHTSG
jgi:hypothetical protein